VIAGRMHKKPVIVRAGYLWAELFEKQNKAGVKTTAIHKLQAFAFQKANHIFATSPAMRAEIKEQYHIAWEKIEVIPNYVDTELFRPLDSISQIPGRIIYVGRLDPIKNLEALIEAVSRIPQASLSLIGCGDAEQRLRQLAQEWHGNVDFLGALPNFQIPTEINRSEIFVLPSLQEGHPKALIEAMACSKAVLGSDVPGIGDVIRHGETGWLCNPDAQSLEQALRILLKNAPLRARLGQNARQFILGEFSLDQISNKEATAISQILAEYQRKHSHNSM
jgi:glycosyltransferase involved in cell wall biosynthesis